MGELSPWHLLILAGVFVLLFGAKRLPDGARSLGRSLRIFKTEVKGLGDGDATDDEKNPAALTAGPATPPVAPGATVAPPPAAPLPAAPPLGTEPPTAAPPVAEPTDPAAAVQQQHKAR
jgi:sec-independent protein translocase protein TatA